MLKLIPSSVFGLALLAACSPSKPEKAEAPAAPPAPPAAAAPAAPALPPVDTANAQQFATNGGALTPLTFERSGSTTVTGSVVGDKAPVYAVPVAAGQTLTVTFQSDSANLYVNVSDAADHSGAALHRGEMDGRTATLKADRDMTFVIVPFQPRAMARRDETAAFSLTVARD
jgi:hypothetical protein